MRRPNGPGHRRPTMTASEFSLTGSYGDRLIALAVLTATLTTLLSLRIASVASAVAVFVARQKTTMTGVIIPLRGSISREGGAKWTLPKMAKACVLGAAIFVTHASGMAAVTSMPSASAPRSLSSLSIIGIVSAAAVVLGLAMFLLLTNRRNQ